MAPFEIVREKLDQAVEVLGEKEIDLWLTFVRETAQVKDPCLDLLLGFGLTWQSALMISRSGKRVAIVGRFDVDNVERMGGYTTVVGYDQSIREPLLEHLTQLNPGKVALNFSDSDPAADGLTHGMFRTLEKIVGDTEYASRFVSAEEVIGALRGRKSPTEVSRIRAAVRATEAIFRHVGQLIQPGLTEREVARLFRAAASDEGLGPAWEADYCPAVTAGPDSPVGHAMPADFTVQRGHLLQVDFGVLKDGFAADLQRTWYLLDEGETGPPEEVLAGWEAAREALEAGRKALRPGARGWEVDRVARESLTQAGYPEYMHAFGHHIGRTAHDGATVLGPHWERYGTSVEGAIEVGNVFAIELGVQVPERGYIGCEEDVLVTPQGAEHLSEPQTELWCI
ncbi:MAG: M24 family metallopeptidase [Anaerolineae bacterium]